MNVDACSGVTSVGCFIFADLQDQCFVMCAALYFLCSDLISFRGVCMCVWRVSPSPHIPCVCELVLVMIAMITCVGMCFDQEHDVLVGDVE